VSPPPFVKTAVPAANPRAPVLRLALDPIVHGVSAWPLFKRSIDVVLAAMMLLATLPLLIAIAIAIKVDSRGPIFHRVRRVGYRGRPFHMLKFRKMYADARGAPLTAAADPRLTRVGILLTRTRLDELPQLWDVLRGRMSIVGPRPEDPLFVALHPEHYDAIHTVRPGITGITQLAFAEETRILDAEDPIGDYTARILPAKVRLDVLYARQSRLRLDLSVLVWTVAAMLMHRPVAVHRSTGRMNVRRRPRRPAVEATDARSMHVVGLRAPRSPEREPQAATGSAVR
jgi:lipopolysaccharide/colanic/teichoic acid biosynthesis glycosyltransferase